LRRLLYLRALALIKTLLLELSPHKAAEAEQAGAEEQHMWGRGYRPADRNLEAMAAWKFTMS
jgi:hypothetical protein